MKRTSSRSRLARSAIAVPLAAALAIRQSAKELRGTATPSGDDTGK